MGILMGRRGRFDNRSFNIQKKKNEQTLPPSLRTFDEVGTVAAHVVVVEGVVVSRVVVDGVATPSGNH